MQTAQGGSLPGEERYPLTTSPLLPGAALSPAHRKGPVVADDRVNLRSPEGQEIEKPKSAVPFFVNQGYKVLKSDGRVNPSPAAAKKTEN